MPVTADRAKPRKAKKSYTLSIESVTFLEDLRKSRRAGSVSAVLEQVLQTARLAQRRQSLEDTVSGYYSSISPEECKESAAWGEFAPSEIPDEVA
jgi:hypothetical protein